MDVPYSRSAYVAYLKVELSLSTNNFEVPFEIIIDALLVIFIVLSLVLCFIYALSPLLKCRYYKSHFVQYHVPLLSLAFGLRSLDLHLLHFSALIGLRAPHFIQTFFISNLASASGNLAIVTPCKAYTYTVFKSLARTFRNLLKPHFT